MSSAPCDVCYSPTPSSGLSFCPDCKTSRCDACVWKHREISHPKVNQARADSGLPPLARR